MSLDISLNLQCLTPLQSIFSELYQSQIPFSLSFRLKRIGHGDPPFCSSLVCAFLGFKKKKKKLCISQNPILYYLHFFLSFSFFTFFFPCIYIFALSFWRTCMCLQGIYFWVVLTTRCLLTTIFFTFFLTKFVFFFCNLCQFFSFIGTIWCLFCTYQAPRCLLTFKKKKIYLFSF